MQDNNPPTATDTPDDPNNSRCSAASPTPTGPASCPSPAPSPTGSASASACTSLEEVELALQIAARECHPPGSAARKDWLRRIDELLDLRQLRRNERQQQKPAANA
jgi:hypothetical protein